MKRSLAAGTVLALGAVLGTGSAAAFASWQDEVTIEATFTFGYVQFAVGDETGMKSIERPGQSLTWNVPEGVLQELGPQHSKSAVVQIDAVSQGNRGLSYTLGGATITGDDTLASEADVAITAVGHPNECTDGGPPVGQPLYEGPIDEASLDARELVTSQYTDTTDPNTDYLCLTFTVPDDLGHYSNTGTVTGTAEGGLEEGQEVTASAEWSGRAEPSKEARDANVKLTLSYDTYRPGEGP